MSFSRSQTDKYPKSGRREDSCVPNLQVYDTKRRRVLSLDCSRIYLGQRARTMTNGCLWRFGLLLRIAWFTGYKLQYLIVWFGTRCVMELLFNRPELADLSEY